MRKQMRELPRLPQLLGLQTIAQLPALAAGNSLISQPLRRPLQTQPAPGMGAACPRANAFWQAAAHLEGAASGGAGAAIRLVRVPGGAAAGLVCIGSGLALEPHARAVAVHAAAPPAVCRALHLAHRRALHLWALACAGQQGGGAAGWPPRQHLCIDGRPKGELRVVPPFGDGGAAGAGGASGAGQGCRGAACAARLLLHEGRGSGGRRLRCGERHAAHLRWN